VALIRQGLAGLAEAGSRVAITVRLTELAEAQALDGKLADALITIDDALQANPEEVVFRPNTLMPRRTAAQTRPGRTGSGRLPRCDRTRPKDAGKGLGAARNDESRPAARIGRPSRRSAHDARGDLQLVHRRLRHRRFERGQGAPGTTVGSACFCCSPCRAGAFQTEELAQTALIKLTTQLRSFIPNLAEDANARGVPSFARFYSTAAGSASELEYHVLFAKDLELIKPHENEELAQRATEVKRMLTRLVQKLNADH
jgi:four helix bundle protein